MEQLGQEVIRLREELGWSKNKLSRQSGLSIHTIYRIEDGKISSAPNYATMYQLSKVFGKSMDYWADFIMQETDTWTEK